MEDNHPLHQEVSSQVWSPMDACLCFKSMQICRQEWTASLPDGAMPRTESLKDLVGGNSVGTSHDKIFLLSISWFSTFPLEPFMSRLEVNSMFSRSRLPELNLSGRRVWNPKFWQGEFFTGLPCDDRLLNIKVTSLLRNKNSLWCKTSSLPSHSNNSFCVFHNAFTMLFTGRLCSA